MAVKCCVAKGELKKLLEQTQGGVPWVFQEVIEAPASGVIDLRLLCCHCSI